MTSDLVDTLNEAGNGVELVSGALSKSLQADIQVADPTATTFISGLDWLHGENVADDGVAIGCLLLVDRSTILVSSIIRDSKEEQAIFGEGFGNSFVVIARQLMAQRLIPARDPR